MTRGNPFTVRLLDGMIRLDWSSSIVVDSTHAAGVIEQTALISRRWTLPMLVHLNTMESVSRCAMRMFARELDVAALAIVGPTAVDRTLSTFFIQVHTPAYPVQHFTTTGPALSWLKGRESAAPDHLHRVHD